jgi:hypothetical protein
MDNDDWKLVREQFALRAVDADSGAPVSNAPVVAVVWRKGE